MPKAEEKKRTPAVPKKKSDITREAIYSAAIKMMAEKGFQGATVRDICKYAGTAVGTFYIYFKTKMDILQDIYQRGDNYFLQVVSKELEGKTCLEKLRLFTRRYAEVNVNTGLDVMRVLFNPENEWFSKRRPMQDILIGIISEGQAEDAFRADIPSERLSEHIFGCLRGTAYAWCVYNASFDLEDRMMEQLLLIVEGIAAEKADFFPIRQKL